MKRRPSALTQLELEMKLAFEPHLLQSPSWPVSGEHIMAHSDDDTIVVYQAYKPSIGRYAIEHGRFGGPDFRLSRMSWIKPNFLWMMYRSGWGTKQGQEITLGLRLRRQFFDELLAKAVPSSFDPQLHPSYDSWQAAVQESEVRVQWDPDHAPSGQPLERRALQLGLRGACLRAFADAELLEVIDLSEFVAEQREHAQDDNPHLLVPVERVYRPRTLNTWSAS